MPRRAAVPAGDGRSAEPDPAVVDALIADLAAHERRGTALGTRAAALPLGVKVLGGLGLLIVLLILMTGFGLVL